MDPRLWGPLDYKKKKKKKNKRKNKKTKEFKVRPYEFDAEHPCCKFRRCCEYFSSDQVCAWREVASQLLQTDGKHALARHGELMHQQMLVSSGRPCCHAYWKWVFGLNNNTKYYVHRGDPIRPANKEITVRAWFENLKRTLDKMPDCEVYQIPCPNRADVFKLYEEDRQEWPNVYPRVAQTYFARVWRDHYKHFKLRKV